MVFLGWKSKPDYGDSIMSPILEIPTPCPFSVVQGTQKSKVITFWRHSTCVPTKKNLDLVDLRASEWLKNYHRSSGKPTSRDTEETRIREDLP